jgi:hypothetical protein
MPADAALLGTELAAGRKRLPAAQSDQEKVATKRTRAAPKAAAAGDAGRGPGKNPALLAKREIGEGREGLRGGEGAGARRQNRRRRFLPQPRQPQRSRRWRSFFRPSSSSPPPPSASTPPAKKEGRIDPRRPLPLPLPLAPAGEGATPAAGERSGRAAGAAAGVWEIPARLIAAAVGSGSRPPSASSRLSEASYFGSQRKGETKATAAVRRTTTRWSKNVVGGIQTLSTDVTVISYTIRVSNFCVYEME